MSVVFIVLQILYLLFIDSLEITQAPGPVRMVFCAYDIYAHTQGSRLEDNETPFVDLFRDQGPVSGEGRPRFGRSQSLPALNF